MEIIKNNIIYFKKYANGVLQEYKKRVACDKDEKMYKTNKYYIQQSYLGEISDYLERTYDNKEKILKNWIAEEMHVSTNAIHFLDSGAYHLNYYRDFRDKIKIESVSFYLDCRLEELPYNKNDLKLQKRKADEEHNKIMVNTFAQSSMKEILDKYGVEYDPKDNKLYATGEKLNEILLQIYSKMLDELKAIGIEAHIRKQLVSPYNNKFLQIANKNSVKLNFGGEGDGKADK